MSFRFPIEQLTQRAERAGTVAVLHPTQRERFLYHRPLPEGWIKAEAAIEILGCVPSSLKRMPIARKPFLGHGFAYLESDVRAHAETPSIKAHRLARELRDKGFT